MIVHWPPTQGGWTCFFGLLVGMMIIESLLCIIMTMISRFPMILPVSMIHAVPIMIEASIIELKMEDVRKDCGERLREKSGIIFWKEDRMRTIFVPVRECVGFRAI